MQLTVVLVINNLHFVSYRFSVIAEFLCSNREMHFSELTFLLYVQVQIKVQVNNRSGQDKGSQ